MKNGSNAALCVSSSIPAPGVRDPQHDVRARATHLDALAGVRLVELDVGRRRILSVPPLGIASRALIARLRTACVELAAVDEDRLQRRLEHCSSTDHVLDRVLQQHERLGDDLVEVAELRVEHLLAAEREQLAGELCARSGGVVDLLRRLSFRSLVIELLEQVPL